MVALALAVSSSAGGVTRVVGGTAIEVQQAPWAVFVENKEATENDECSGSIIDAQLVLTAAHCLFDSAGNQDPPSQLTVEAGVSNATTPLSTDAEQVRAVSSFTIHPGYTPSSTPGPDDVAVLALASPLSLGGAVQAVTLPTPGAAFPGGAAVAVAGFGEESAGTSPSGQLNWMTGTVDAQGTCGADESVDDDATRLCASSPTSSTCEGDSGSGLVTTGSTPTLLGVLSAGPASCAPGGHSIYTYLGAPEIMSFVQGNQQPPTAPREQPSTYVNLTWLGTLAVGTKLTCATGDWSDAPTSYSYAFVDAATSLVLQQGARATFVPTRADLGDPIACNAFASNAGGTAVVMTTASPAVAAASPSTATTPASTTPHTTTTGSGGSVTAREWNAETIENKADAIPLPSLGSALSVGVPKWDGYLRLALLGNQNPDGPRYQDTYVRCWSSAAWPAAARAAGATTFSSTSAPLGFYVKGSPWIDVSAAACANAAKAARGTIDTTTAVALASVLHETFNRQGIANQATATCLGAVGVWQAVNRHVGASAATHAFDLVLAWYRGHLAATGLHALATCASRISVNWNG